MRETVAATFDEIERDLSSYRPDSLLSAVNAAAGEPKEMVCMPGLHMQGSRPDVLRQLIDAVMERTDLTPKPTSAATLPH
jgi:hypothetical protein